MLPCRACSDSTLAQVENTAGEWIQVAMQSVAGLMHWLG